MYLISTVLYITSYLSHSSSSSDTNTVSPQLLNGSFPGHSMTYHPTLSRRSHPFLDCEEHEQLFLQEFLRSKIANVFRAAARAASPHGPTSRFNDAKFQEYFGSRATPANDHHKKIVFERYKSLAIEASLTPYGRIGIYCHGEMPQVARLHGRLPSGMPGPICREPGFTVGEALYTFFRINELVLVRP